MRKNPPRGRDVTQQILDTITAQREFLYASGAIAKVRQEIALTQLSIYRKPARAFTLWNNANSARIDGKWAKVAAEADYGPDMPTFSDEDIEELTFNRNRRDAGSSYITQDIEDEPIERVPVSHRVTPTHRLERT